MTSYTVITETNKTLNPIDIKINLVQKNGKIEINVESNASLIEQKEVFKLINSAV